MPDSRLPPFRVLLQGAEEGDEYTHKKKDIKAENILSQLCNE